MKKIFFTVLFVFSVLMFVGCEFSANNNQNENLTQDTISVIDTINTVETDSLVQCVGITKKGTQCTRLVNYPDSLCFQHTSQAQK